MSDLLNSASLVMIPSGYKEDVVYSEVPTNGNGDLSFTRASNGTRVNSAGLVEDVAWNMAEQSNAFETYPWSNNLDTGATLTYTANYGTAPDGTTTAGRLQMALNGSNYVQKNQIISVITGQQYTYSVWIKSLSGTKDVIFCYDNTNNIHATVTTEWQRFTHTFTGNSQVYCRFVLESGTSTSVDLLVYGAQLNIGSTAKPYFPTTDRLNVPRLTYQNGGGGCPSLLLEKQSTNLALESNTLTTNPNVVDFSTATANVYVSPDGTQNAMRFTETTNNDRHGFYQYTTVTAQTYTASIFTKQTGRRYISFNSDITGTSATSFFDLQTISVVSSGSGYTCSIQDFGNGWLRLILTFTASAGSRYIIWGGSPDGINYQYTGSTSISQTFYGYQLEASSYPTSYIPTTSSSATRVADNASRNGLALTNFTFAVNFKPLDYGVELFDFQKTVGGRMFYVAVQSNGFITFNGVSGGTIGGIGSIIPKLQTCKLAFSLNASTSDLKIYINGSIIGTYTTNITTFGDFLGLQSFGYNPGTQIEQIAIFPSVLTDAECQSLTTL